MSFVRNIVGGGRIASEAAARSVIRRVAWSYITLAAAMFVFEEALAADVNATDWSGGAALSKSVGALIVLAPPVAVLLTRSRMSAVVMGLLAGALAFALGAMSTWLESEDYRLGGRLDPWEVGIAVLSLGWLLIAVAAWRAFQAARLLRRLSLEGPRRDAAVFD